VYHSRAAGLRIRDECALVGVGTRTQDMNQKLLADFDVFAAELEASQGTTANLTGTVDKLAAAHAAAEQRSAEAAAAVAARLLRDSAAASLTRADVERLQVRLTPRVTCCVPLAVAFHRRQLAGVVERSSG
jgi:hypothetical protein